MAQEPTNPDRIALQAEPLDVAVALQFVAAAEAGGLTSF